MRRLVDKSSSRGSQEETLGLLPIVDVVEAPTPKDDDVESSLQVHKLKKRLWASSTRAVVEILLPLEPSKVKNTKTSEGGCRREPFERNSSKKFEKKEEKNSTRRNC